MTQSYVFIATSRTLPDARASALLHDAQSLGFTEITQITSADCYFFFGQLTAQEQQYLAETLLIDPLVQTGVWQEATTSAVPGEQIITTVLRDGVTDPIAEQIQHTAKTLGIQGIEQVRTGQYYTLHSPAPLAETALHTLARRLLANPVIHHYALHTLTDVFQSLLPAAERVATIAIRDLNSAQLQALAQQRRLALDIAEMHAIQAYYRQQQRDPTDVELEMIAQTWSEHCSHKTFRATISAHTEEGGQEAIHGLLNTYIRAATEKIAAPWVHSAFVDNAGIIEFDDQYDIAFKVETHNHPSAIEPFGGANTGLGGVIRDILGVSARPIANTDIFCLGFADTSFEYLPPETLHPRRIRSGVVAGVQDYGNKTGIPTVNGAIYYDDGFIANPLVFCGCVGLLPQGSHPRQPQPHDHLIVLGGRTGRDGLRGATFSSMTMDAQTADVAGACVQIGHPIIAKGLIEVVIRAREQKLYHAITDCGAGGLSSAVGEMASEIGAEVELAHVPLKYPGLAPWEIWLSEAQERMVLAVPAENIPALQQLCDIFAMEWADIGQFVPHQQLIVRYHNENVLQLDNHFLFSGMPEKTLVAHLPAPRRNVTQSHQNISNYAEYLLQLLSHPTIASKEKIIRRYDHEVQGGTVIKPLVGVTRTAPGDACVLKPQGTTGWRGIVLANGINPELGKYDAYAMAVSVIDEAIRNAVAVGANPGRIAILDNFCWGDPQRPEILGSLVQTARGCYDAAVHYGTPFISGKDSLNNEYITAQQQRQAIPGTLLISALGIIDDIRQAVTMDFKQAGNAIYLIGTTHRELSGSHYLLCGGEIDNAGNVPGLPSMAPALYRALHAAMQQNLVRACHDLSEGGLAVALAEMGIGGQLGCHITLPLANSVVALFSESNGRLLVEVAAAQRAAFESIFASWPQEITCLGEVTALPILQIYEYDGEQCVIDLPIAILQLAYHTSEVPLGKFFGKQ